MTTRLVAFLMAMQVLVLAYGLTAALADVAWLRVLHLPVIVGATGVVLAVASRGGSGLRPLLRTPHRPLLVVLTLVFVVILCSASLQLVWVTTRWESLAAVLICWSHTSLLWWEMAPACALRSATGRHAVVQLDAG